MCGIVGRVNFKSGSPVTPSVLGDMCELIRHRGPDGDGVWASGHVGFGHRRLAVIDLSPAGRQPMHTADGELTITFNGEIYNFEEIRDELAARGCRFVSRSDTEVILQAYREFGVDCLSRLRGMFAFAIWDSSKNRLFAARDRIGKKPFYYREDADGLAFASEPKAFLAEPSFTPAVDRTALYDYLSFQYVPSPDSAFQGLKRLSPGHYLLQENGRIAVNRYWSLGFEPKTRASEDDAAEGVLEQLRVATRLRLISDVPLGAFLSGGVDSSLVVALMSEAGGGRVKTFSIGFDEKEYDERPFAKQVAQLFGTDHHELTVRPDAVALMPKLVWHYNEPFADSSAIPTFYLAEMTRRHVTVALNGDGGDESFAGYERYLASLLARRIERIPLALRRRLARAAAGIQPGPSRTFRSRTLRFLQGVADLPERRYARWIFHFDDETKRQLCSPEFLAGAGSGESAQKVESLFEQAGDVDFIDALLSVDASSYLPDDLLVKVDIASMACGLEARSPLLDHKVMESAARLPVSMKLKGAEKKYLLRKIARRVLPASIIDRRKMGFGVPLERWLREDLRDMVHDVVLGQTLRRRGYFNAAFLERIVREHEQRIRNWQYPLWNLLMFELWHQTFIDRPPARR